MNSTKAHTLLPVAAADGMPPAAAAYRLHGRGEAVDHSRCLARRTLGAQDERWTTHVYCEYQCSRRATADSDLCSNCSGNEKKFLTLGRQENGGSRGWAGRITEEPPDWIHMLGTAWAEAKKPKWLGGAPAPAPVPVLVVREADAPPPSSRAALQAVLAELGTLMEPVNARSLAAAAP